MTSICFHGAESTGKTVLIKQLAEEYGCPWVPEYGRAYAEERGTDFTMDDLLAIARGQDEAMREARQQEPALLLLDTDPLMTAAWAQMLFGEIPDELLSYPKSDHYLLFEPDVPWKDDGTRMFGADDARHRFATIAEDMLVRTKVPFTRVSGGWREREIQARDAIAAHIAGAGEDRVDV